MHAEALWALGWFSPLAADGLEFAGEYNCKPWGTLHRRLREHSLKWLMNANCMCATYIVYILVVITARCHLDISRVSIASNSVYACTEALWALAWLVFTSCCWWLGACWWGQLQAVGHIFFPQAIAWTFAKVINECKLHVCHLYSLHTCHDHLINECLYIESSYSLWSLKCHLDISIFLHSILKCVCKPRLCALSWFFAASRPGSSLQGAWCGHNWSSFDAGECMNFRSSD